MDVSQWEGKERGREEEGEEGEGGKGKKSKNTPSVNSCLRPCITFFSVSLSIPNSSMNMLTNNVAEFCI